MVHFKWADTGAPGLMGKFAFDGMAGWNVGVASLGIEIGAMSFHSLGWNRSSVLRYSPKPSGTF